MKVIAIEGYRYIQLFYLESKKPLSSLNKECNEENFMKYDSLYEDFDKNLFKIEIDLNEDLYNTAINFQKIKDSVIQDMFIETIKNLMNESNNINANIFKP